MTSRFVVDNSIVMTWCFADEGNEYTEAVLESFETAEAFVPAIWPLEVGNVLLVAERRKRLNQASVFRFLELLKELPIMVEQETPERMLQEIVYLARKYGLSTYDASYLDLALRLDLPISTLDALLMKAAKKCKVQNYNPLDSK
jgi:predicted nucleic acid-binding protein